MISNLTVKDAFSVDHLLQIGDTKAGVEVSWIYKGDRILKKVVDPKKQSLIVGATRNGEDIIVIFGSLADVSPNSGAMLLNPDGSVRYKLEIPELLSEKYKAFEAKQGIERARQSTDFLNFYVKNGQIYFWIGFDYDWFEIREFDPTIGKFGKCVGVSRT